MISISDKSTLSKDNKQSTYNYLKDVIYWYYETKKTADGIKKSFEEAKYDFGNIMEDIFDMFAEDNKVKISSDGRYANIKHIIVTKVVPSKVFWHVNELKKLLSKKERKLVIRKVYSVKDWKGLLGFLKDSGIDFNEFKKYVTITEEVNEKELDKLIDLGLVNEEDVKNCCSISMKRPQYRITEK